MFTHDRILGVQYLGKVEKLDFSADRDSTLGTFQGRDASDNKEAAARIVEYPMSVVSALD